MNFVVAQVAKSVDSDLALELRHGQSGVHTLSKQSVDWVRRRVRPGRGRWIFPAPFSLEGIRWQRYFQRLVGFIEGFPIDAGATDVQRGQAREHALPTAVIAFERRKHRGLSSRIAETPGSGGAVGRPHSRKTLET